MIKGVIFDMDGVISDTQKQHAFIEADILSRYGIIISPEEITRQYAGVNTKKIFHELLKDQTIKYDVDELMEEKWNKITALADESVEAINGSIELIKSFHTAGFKLAVASASNLKYVEKVIDSLAVRNYFDFLVGGDMVTNGKPDPESFLLAASKIGIEPEYCLVIEDGRSGMTAAKVAGMKCIGLVQNIHHEYPTKNLVTSLKHIDIVGLHDLS
mgnify:CR=1 FL=1